MARKAANADLPPGSEMIPPADAFRNARSPRKELSRKRVTLWVDAAGRPYPDDAQEHIKPRGDGAGRVPNGRVATGQRTFDRITFVPVPNLVFVPGLAEGITLPALTRGEVPGWVPEPHGDHPTIVLAALDRLESQDPSGPPKPQIEFVPVDESGRETGPPIAA